MSMSPNREMITNFIEEVTSYIPTLTNGLESLKKEPGQIEVLEESHRLVHTIKGASSLVGLNGLSQIAFQMEDFLEDLISSKQAFSDDAFRVMQKTVKVFKKYCLEYMSGGVASRALLRETVIEFKRLRGLPTEKDRQSLDKLLETVPENERLNTKEKTETEQCPEAAAGPLNQKLPECGEETESTFLSESVPMDDSIAKADDGKIRASDYHQKNRVEISPEILESFYEEAEEHLEDLGRSLNVLDTQVKESIPISPTLREASRRFRRSVHTLKGAAAVIGFQDFATFAHSFEDLLDWLFEEAREISPEIVAVLVESSDLLERMITQPTLLFSPKVHSLDKRYKKIMRQDLARNETIISESTSEVGSETIIEQNPILQPEKSVIDDDQMDVFEKRLHPDDISELSTRVTKTLKVDMARYDELVNLSGELIIALSAFDQKMEAFTDSVNDLELYRERLKQISRDLEVSYEVEALEQLRAMPDFAAESRVNTHHAGDFEDFDTLELDRYSELNLIIRQLNEAAVDVGALHTHLANLHSDFDSRLNRQRIILSELQNKMMGVRMTPFALITNKLRMTVREVAGNLNKKVKLVVIGEDIELDKLIWEKVSDPLMHLLRNAVDHGVESQKVRQSLGKPPTATIMLEATREGNQVVIRILDDGAGLDYSAIRAMVRKMRLSDRVDQMSDDELSQFIFYPGFSTRAEIDEISGRGVGMDVVKENILNLKGAIRVASEKGQGTRFTIRIPLTLAAVQALLFAVRGQTYAIALNEISEIIRLDLNSILGTNQDAMRLKDEVLPLFHMADLLRAGKEQAVSVPVGESSLTLVVETGGRRACLVIDSLVGQKEIVIKNLGSHLRYVKGVSGATILGDGSVIPILNVEELLWSQTAVLDDPIADTELIVERPLNIMVVDDSVSIRQVVSRLMEDQGWRVQTAKDGIDALEKLHQSRPDLIVLDIEMPRMNGYEFLGAIKAQVEFEDIPVVILTSRTATKHRDKAKAMGAKGFIVKPYNDDKFVRLISKLTGRERG